MAPLPSSHVVQVEPRPNTGHDAIKNPVCPKTSHTDGLSLVFTEEHTTVTNDRPKRLRTQLSRIRMSQLEEGIW